MLTGTFSSLHSIKIALGKTFPAKLFCLPEGLLSAIVRIRAGIAFWISASASGVSFKFYRRISVSNEAYR